MKSVSHQKSVVLSLIALILLIASQSQASANRCANLFTQTLLEKFFDVSSLQPLISNKQAIISKDGYRTLDVQTDNNGVIINQYAKVSNIKFEENGTLESTEVSIPLNDLINTRNSKSITISDVSDGRIIVESSEPRMDFKGHRIVYTLTNANGRLVRMKTAQQSNEATYLNDGKSIEVMSEKNGIFNLNPMFNVSIIDFQRTSDNKFIIYTADGYWSKFNLQFDQNGKLINMILEFSNRIPDFETFFPKVQRTERM